MLSDGLPFAEQRGTYINSARLTGNPVIDAADPRPNGDFIFVRLFRMDLADQTQSQQAGEALLVFKHDDMCFRSHSVGRSGIMKHLFAITVLLLTACSWAVGDAASDERELTQLVKDLNAAIVKPDMDFLERVLDKDYVHYRPRGNVENRSQYLENRKSGRVDFDSLVADEIKVRIFGDTAIVTYRSTAKGKDQNGAIDEQRRWTRVFVRKDGRWHLVHSQGTTIQKP